jgi:predicted ArsR family transcriptional regulator
MSEHTVADTSSPALGESRARVLDLLRVAGGPLSVQEVAARSGLHVNTARFHLDGLVDAGLAERAIEGRGQPGRPRAMYQADAAGDQVGRRSYQLLAQMLTSLVADVVPRTEHAAVEAGRAWGGYLAERPAPSQRVDAADGIRRLSAVLASAGFAPGVVADLADPVIPLRHCPFREIAREHPEVVCSLHLGLMQGVLTEVRAPVVADRLDPFVEPSLCLAHLKVTAQR